MKKLKNFVILFAPLIGGIIVSLLVDTKSFDIVNKPPLSPPAIVFPIVWTILYLLMGISLYLIKKYTSNKTSTKIFMFQLILNYIWSFIFFTFKLYTLAVIIIIILLILVSIMIDNFKKIKKIAGYLQIPYFIWLIIALYLCVGITTLN